jgi:hypothetical protein
MRVRLAAAFAALLVIAVTVPLRAQEDRGRALAGVEYYGVSFGAGIGTKSVRELVVPLGVMFPIGRRLTIDAGTYVVSAERTDEANASATINGLTDLVVRGAWRVRPDVFTLTVAVNVPTGQATLDGDQLLVAGAVATDLIPFPVTSFGSGFNVTTGAAVAVPVAGWALGLAGSYRYNGDYEPLADTSVALQPGAEYRVRIGADRLVGQGRLALGVTFSTFSRDEFGADQLSGGQRLISQASLSLPIGNSTLAFYGWDVLRNSDSSDVALQQKQNTIALGTLVTLPLARGTLRPSVEVRKAWAGVTTLEDAGTQVGLGLRYQRSLSRRFTVLPGFRFDFGSLPGTGGAANVSYTGVSASLAVRAAL